MNQDVSKVLFIVFDGATFDVIQPLMSEGKMPAFQNLMSEGVWGNLTSTIMPETATAWSSLCSGKNPGKTGIYGFFQKKPNEYDCFIINGANRRTESIWDVLSEYNKKCVVMNVPLTYPPTKLNGIMITGWLTPDETPFTYPEELTGQLVDIGYKPSLYYPTGNSNKDFQETVNTLKKKTEVAADIMREHEWDFCMMGFEATDQAGHLFWCKDQNKVFKIYKAIDETLEKLLKSAGDDVTVVIASDHGFGAYKKGLFIDSWLFENGYLQTRINKREYFNLKEKEINKKLKPLSQWRRLFYKTLINLAKIKQLVTSKPLPFPRFLVIPPMVANISAPEEIIDWEQTRVYPDLESTGNYGALRINLRGREPNGIVLQGKEYEDLLKELTENLMELKDPHTGEKIAKAIYRREALYSGPYLEEIYDLVIELHKDYAFLVSKEAIFKGQVILPPQCVPWHTLNGIFLIKGENVVKETNIGANIIDIAPTIMYMMGLPISSDMDGKVLEGAIKKSYLQEHPITYTPEKHKEYPRYGTIVPSLEHDQEIKERLRRLGYLE